METKLYEKELQAAFVKLAPQMGIEVLDQYVKCPVGEIDVLGVLTKGFYEGSPVIVELKAGKAPESTAGQLLGYVSMLNNMIEIECSTSNYFTPKASRFSVIGIVVSESLRKMTDRAIKWSNELRYLPYTFDGKTITFHPGDKWLSYWEWPDGERVLFTGMEKIVDIARQKYIREYSMTHRGYLHRCDGDSKLPYKGFDIDDYSAIWTSEDEVTE